MSNTTFIQIPKDVSNPVELRRFLQMLIEQLDIAFGNRGSSGFNTEIQTVQLVTEKTTDLVKLDGSRSITGVLSYSTDKTFSGDYNIVNKKFVADSIASAPYTNNPQQAAISSLSASLVSVSAVYSQSEVQAIAQQAKAASDKIDAVLSALSNSSILA